MVQAAAGRRGLGRRDWDGTNVRFWVEAGGDDRPVEAEAEIRVVRVRWRWMWWAWAWECVGVRGWERVSGSA